MALRNRREAMREALGRRNLLQDPSRWEDHSRPRDVPSKPCCQIALPDRQSTSSLNETKFASRRKKSQLNLLFTATDDCGHSNRQRTRSLQLSLMQIERGGGLLYMTFLFSIIFNTGCVCTKGTGIVLLVCYPYCRAAVRIPICSKDLAVFRLKTCQG